MPSESQRILIVAPQPFYQDRGTPIAVLHTAKSLQRAGYEVHLATFSGGRDPEGAAFRIFRAKSRWSSADLPIGLSWRKVAQHYSLYRLVQSLLRQHEYAAVHAVEEGVITARLLLRKSKTPIIYDMHSLLSDELKILPVLGAWPIGNFICAIERRFASGVKAIACSAGLKDAAIAVSGKRDVTEWRFPSQRAPLDADQKSQIRKDYGLRTDSELIVYSGNLAPGQNINLLVEGLTLLVKKRPAVEAIIIGATAAELELIRKTLSQHDLPQVQVVERQSRSRALDLMAAADVAVSLRVRGLNAPLKLFDYIGAGVPVVATDIPAHRAILGDAAIYVEPSAPALRDGLLELLENRQRHNEVSGIYRQLTIDSLGEDHFAATVADLYQRVLGTNSTLPETSQSWRTKQSPS